MKLDTLLTKEYETLSEKELLTKDMSASKDSSLELLWKKMYKKENAEVLYLINKTPKLFSFLSKKLTSISYSTAEITKLCFTSALQKNLAIPSIYFGCFLSCAIQTHYDKNKETKEYVLVTKHFERETMEYSLNGLAYYNNGPTILIDGDSGDNTCSLMKKGTVRILGNVYENAGTKMTGGKIIIEGNTEEYCGFRMNGGYIHVKGNTDPFLAKNMQGGTIRVDGKINDTQIVIYSRMIRGKIYNKKSVYIEKK